MSAIDKKLLRDLSNLRGQVVTIALVVACGIAGFVTMRSTFDSLVSSRDAYYAQHRFADVFAHLERAPESVRARIEAIPGVGVAATRVVEGVMLPMPNMARPATGTVVSVPVHGEPPLNAVHLRTGRTLDPSRDDEVMLLEAFANAHGIEPGDEVPAVINGALRRLRVVGLAMAPEYVLAMAPGELTVDPKRIAVLWMSRRVLEAAFQMEGAFNDVTLRLQPGASKVEVIERLDGILEPFGGLGAIGRDKQQSNFMLEGELMQLETWATAVPLIFLAVAAFLLNVVLSRLVHLQRQQIATLKAIGYPDWEIGLHYVKLVSVIVVIGAVVGLTGGAQLGDAYTALYTGQFFRFPSAEYRLDAQIAWTAVIVSLVAAVVGALAAAYRVAKLPPAEAMRPPAPASYRRTFFERIGVFAWLGPAARMVLREAQRRPLRVVLSAIGISMAIGIVVVGRFMYDAMEHLMEVQFHRAMREDVTVTFSKPLADRSIRELRHFPGVLHAEGIRMVPVRLRAGHRFRDSALQGHTDDSELRHVLDRDGERTVVPPNGVVLTEMLGDILDVRVGDRVSVELLEGNRGIRQVVIAGFVDDAFGLQGHMSKGALHDLLKEDAVANMGLLRVDPLRRAEVESRLKKLPWVAAVGSPGSFREQFEAQSGGMMAVFTFILTLFATVIAVGVIYNNARVALSQRNRDLASLRVLGFTRREIAGILFGELSIQVFLAIPIGLFVGHWMVTGIMTTVDPETYRLPVLISLETYAFATIVALASAVASALLVRRKLDRLDLIAVLKTRE